MQYEERKAQKKDLKTHEMHDAPIFGTMQTEFSPRSEREDRKFTTGQKKTMDDYINENSGVGMTLT